MKIKIGQSARLDDGSIGEYIGMCDGECNHIMLKTKQTYHYEDDIIKVANTPQELIQVGDLYEINNSGIPKCIENKEQLRYLKGLKFMKYNKITKIYTPNEDKSVYTSQWEAKQ